MNSESSGGEPLKWHKNSTGLPQIHLRGTIQGSEKEFCHQIDEATVQHHGRGQTETKTTRKLCSVEANGSSEAIVYEINGKRKWEISWLRSLISTYFVHCSRDGRIKHYCKPSIGIIANITTSQCRNWTNRHSNRIIKIPQIPKNHRMASNCHRNVVHIVSAIAKQSTVPRNWDRKRTKRMQQRLRRMWHRS